MSSKKYTAWDRKGAIAKELVKNFDLFTTTNGSAGIDPSIKKPATIKEIYDRHQFLQPLNPQYFPNHFRSLSTDWKLNKDCIRGGGEASTNKSKCRINQSFFSVNLTMNE